MYERLKNFIEKSNFKVIENNVTDESKYFTFEDEEVLGTVYNNATTMSGRQIFIDRKEYFRGISTCPVKLRMAISDDEFRYILQQVNWLKKDEGKQIASSLDITKFKLHYGAK